MIERRRILGAKPSTLALAASVSIVVACGVPPATTTPAAPESPALAIPRFDRVDGRLYRGGQPEEGSLASLAALGVRTIVNLRGEGSRAEAEGAEARAAGLRYVSVPMPVLLRPKPEQIDRVLAILDDPDAVPVFVHCKAGEDRTGAVVACYRMARYGWTAEEAIREAREHGMRRIEFAKRAFVRDYCETIRVRPDERSKTNSAR